jgi:hypothetical protein
MAKNIEPSKPSPPPRGKPATPAPVFDFEDLLAAAVTAVVSKRSRKRKQLSRRNP